MVFHQSQGQTGRARCAATALGFPVPMPFVQEPGFFWFPGGHNLWCALVVLFLPLAFSVVSNSCSGSLLSFGFLEWMVVGLLPMLVPVLMDWGFFSNLALVIFQTAKKC